MDTREIGAGCLVISLAFWLIGIAHIKWRTRLTVSEAEKVEMIELDVPVQRDDMGWWSNPSIPNFDEDHAAYRAWLEAQGIEIKWYMLEDEPETHPAYIEYYDKNSNDVSAWDCRRPGNEGWHTFSIHDSEDGPVWVWARRVAPVGGNHG